MNTLPAKKTAKQEVIQDIEIDISAVEKAIAMNDIGSLTPKERLAFYKAVCDSVGLNVLTKPFEYILFQGKLQLYANKNCAEQLRQRHGISCDIIEEKLIDGTLMMKAKAIARNGRFDTSTGAVDLGNKRGEDKANAFMKCETKAKRRVTLSICGLGMLDESEAQTLQGAKFFSADEMHAEGMGTITVTTQEVPKKQPKPQKSREEQVVDMINAFHAFDVTIDDIESYITKSIEDITDGDVTALKKKYAELKGGASRDKVFSGLAEFAA